MNCFITRGRKTRLGASLFAMCCLQFVMAAPIHAQGLDETFDSNAGFSTSEPFFVDTGGDFFGISDGAGGGDFGAGAPPPGVKAYSGFTGSFLTGMDLDGEGAALPIVVDWTGIDISSFSAVEFSGDFAEFFDSPGDIDQTDYIRVSAQIDGGGYQEVLWFSGADFTSTGGPFNGNFRVDDNFDGTGEGNLLGGAAQTFTRAIAGTGSVLDLRLSLLVEAGDEDFGVDNFKIAEGDGVVEQCVGAVSIASVQGAGDVTPEAGNEVIIRGLVTADFGSEIIVQENTSDPRSGITVFASGNSASRGDEVCVTGIASERFGQTQVGGNENPSATVEVLSVSNALPAPAILDTVAANSEDWESVLIRVETVTVADPDLGFGEFSVDDGTGPVRVDDKGSFSFTPTAGKSLEFVQGPLAYTFDNFKITPRDDDDLGIPPEVCGDSVTLISAIQGSGDSSPILGSSVSIEAIVIGDFQDDVGANGDLNGFYVQEEDGDADTDPTTSEGVFVFQGSNPAVDVAIGDLVRVSGTVDEFSGQTQVDDVNALLICDTGLPVPAVTSIELPLMSEDALEAVEGMYVTFPQSLTIIEYFNFDRFGEFALATDRLTQPTAIFEPGTTEAADLGDLNDLSRVLVDDGRTASNPDPAIHPDGMEFTLDNRFRGGDLVTNATGVMGYSFGSYRLQPTQGADYTAVNEREPSPEPVGGDIQVASFNVLNYFNTIDNGTNDVCGANQDLECRGADNLDEQTRQLTKIVSALAAIDADVYGLIELENTPGVEAMADIVDGLNALIGSDDFAYIDTGVIGTDAIKVGFVYNTTTVAPVGDFAVLDTPEFVNPFDAVNDRNRPALAQTFAEIVDGGAVTVVVNHLKSKGSGCGEGDDDPEQGSRNLTRTVAAQALADWLATDPTGSGDADVLIIGDLNSYDKEDPIFALTGSGYTDLLLLFQGEFAYSFVFSGEWGYLDYALANDPLLIQVTGAAAYAINADEPDILDYDTSFKQDAQDALYEPNQFRSSDHDPVIVGLDLNAPPSCVAAEASVTDIWPPRHQLIDVMVLGVTDPDGDDFTIEIDSIFQDESVNGEGDGNTDPDGFGIGTDTAQVRAERSGGGNGRVYTIGFTATDVFGNSCSGTVQSSVALSKGGNGAAIDDGPLFDSTVSP